MASEATGNQIIFKNIYTELGLLCPVFYHKNKNNFLILCEVLYLCLISSVAMYEYESGVV